MEGGERERETQKELLQQDLIPFYPQLNIQRASRGVGEATASTKAESPALRTLPQREGFKPKLRGKKLTAHISAAC